jgi:hypothetical protein
VSPASTSSNSAHDGASSTTSSSRQVAAALGGLPARKSPTDDPVLHRTVLSQNTDQSPNAGSLSQRSPLAQFSKESKLGKWNGLNKLKQTYLPMMKQGPTRASQESKEVSEESESASESSADDDSDEESDEDVGGIPKSKLAGRTPMVKKKKSGGLRALFK